MPAQRGNGNENYLKETPKYVPHHITIQGQTNPADFLMSSNVCSVCQVTLVANSSIHNK
jgi:hypothetical protein